MTAPSLAQRLRAIVDSLDSDAWQDSENPDVIALKRILLARIAELEAEATKESASQANSN
jgi:hypothetical protein